MTQATETRNAPTKLAHATIYRRGPFGYRKILVRDLEITVRAYAQYSHAVEITYVEKGCRKRAGFMETYKPGAVIVDGHCAWDPPSGMEQVSAAGEVGGTGITISRSIGASFDPIHDSRFSSALARSGLTIHRDFRGHNPYSGDME